MKESVGNISSSHLFLLFRKATENLTSFQNVGTVEEGKSKKNSKTRKKENK